MNRYRCLKCDPDGADDWTDHRRESHCRQCGELGVRVYEYGCFECNPEGVLMWQPEDVHHACPDCGSDVFRVVHAPMVVTQSRHESFSAADKMLETELERQGASTTTLTRPAPAANGNPFAAHWAAPNQVIPPGGHGPGGTLPFGMPRPQTRIVGRHDANS